MKKKPVLLLNGNPLQLGIIPPSAYRVMDFLKRLPDNELLDTRELSKRTNVSYENITNRFSRYEILNPYRAQVCRPRFCLLWGNAKTIKQLLTHKELLA